MKSHPEVKRRAYVDVDPRHLILRDHLALDRTTMANERTLLSYFRTGIALLVTGLMLVRFRLQPGTQDPWSLPLAVLMCCGAGFLAAVGVWRFWQMRTRLKDVYDS